jgi:MFS family permease
VDQGILNPHIYKSTSKLLLLGILSAVFAVNVIDVFVPLMLPEIANTYGISRAAAANFTAYSLLAGVVTGFALSAASVKVGYKNLLIMGVLTTPVCVLGVYLAPTFWLAQLFYALNGVGSVIVAAMSPSLIADLYPLDKKALRISWIQAAAYIAILVANPITGFLSNNSLVSSWRNSLLWFLLPITAAALLFVILFVPSRSSSLQSELRKTPFISAFRAIIKNRSAMACLISNFLMGGTWLAVSVFGPSFNADIFKLSPAFRGILGSLTLGSIVSGILIGGFLVNKIGRKRMTLTFGVSAILISVLSYVLMLVIPNLFLHVGLGLISAFVGGFVFASGPNLSVEQVPEYRGTNMLLAQGAIGTGRAIGVFIAGAILTLLGNSIGGYTTAIVVLGILGLTGGLTMLLFAKDPCLGTKSKKE